MDFKRKEKYFSATILISTCVAKFIHNVFRIMFRSDVMDTNSDRNDRLYIRIEI